MTLTTIQKKSERLIRTSPDMKSPIVPGGLITEIEPGSPASELDLVAGDRIMSINGAPVRDVIDFQFSAADDDLAMVIQRSGHMRTIQATGDQAVGVRFKDPTFDGVTWCNNKCPFCFVKMNPARARPSLYIKDDDYRYSALYGNFVTLTNLLEEDWKRIEEQRLSPLYVSVHATRPELRQRLLGNPNAPDVRDQLDRLASIGILCHTQAVLCPGINDDDALDETIEEIAARHPTTISLSIVPVGLTDVGKHPPYLRRHTAEEAASIVRRCEVYRRRFRRTFKSSFLYPSDEFYLMGNVPVPAARTYDGYEQYQNGVGMVRSLQDDWTREQKRRGRWSVKRSATGVCGRLIEPYLEPIFRELRETTGISIELLGVTNSYFGPSVNVSGLLTSGDILKALQPVAADNRLGDLIILPRASLDIPGHRFLDDVTPAAFAREIGRPIVFVETVRDLMRALSGDETGVVQCAA